ncbi:MAG: hypothetical protein AAF623_19165 [Planctomycetota bacterium]
MSAAMMVDAQEKKIADSRPKISKKIRKNNKKKEKIQIRPDSQSSFETNIEKVVGVGLMIRLDETTNQICTVIQTIPGSSAANCKRIQPGDQLVGITDSDGNFHRTKKKKLEFIVGLLRGPEESKVTVKLRSKDGRSRLSLDLKRTELNYLTQDEKKNDWIEKPIDQ